ncbi:GNAT family N-acetyltransferase [Pimelobacter simplex]|uniref:GNAT family N-acetyltransferase n=1 Tax=Nocardioides simplex TaxID=2045 RepID=UPI0019329AD9|nr:GNAT family N-acetyltransferase [Pimelobacter simplex]
MNDLAIRPYEPRDWPAVAAIITEVLSAGETYAVPVLDDAEARDFWLGQPGAVAVAEADGVVVGTAKMGPNRPAQGSHIGTASFMVSTAARGAGVGRALGEHVVAWHREQGFAGIQFNAVVATNTAAVALWRSLGFQVIGTVPDAFRRPDGSLAGLHVMFLDLAGVQA